MTFILQKTLNNCCRVFLAGVIFGVGCLSTVHAQEALSLSVSPTLFDMTANPGQEWSSSLRVINPNPYDITVYIDVVNFAAEGESGQGKFLPVLDQESKQNDTVAQWIDITQEEITITAEQTHEVPFSMRVPVDAPPGGHFAAILVGTKPPEDTEEVVQVRTSQIVTTLLFLGVTGDVVEAGSIRSFRTTGALLEKPVANFELRFENSGNVHLQPQGEIRILNMWGQERGIIPVNRETLFGNVLPDTIRKFSFTWTGEWSLGDIGRYTAIATLAYGESGRKFTSSDTAFWVIPWKSLLLIVFLLAAFITLIVWSVKLYIKKMLSLAGVNPEYHTTKTLPAATKRRVSVVAPLEAGMLDLSGRLKETSTLKNKLATVFEFVKNYKLFFLAFIGILFFVWAASWFIQSAAQDERSYEVVIENETSGKKISSEDTAYNAINQGNLQHEKTTVDPALPTVVIVNRSGENGLAGRLKFTLEQAGYQVNDVSTDFGVSEKKTVIVYNPELAKEALALSDLLSGVLLSAYQESAKITDEMVIYVGKDIVDAL